MRILLDTHCWLWMEAAPERLGERVQEILEDPETELRLSSASVWELAIKIALGKLELPEPIERYVPARLTRGSVEALPIRHEHALEVAALPPHHADPFDRMLIAQARRESLVLLTADAAFAPYQVELLRPA